jgi:hypothetical protein
MIELRYVCNLTKFPERVKVPRSTSAVDPPVACREWSANDGLTFVSARAISKGGERCPHHIAAYIFCLNDCDAELVESHAFRGYFTARRSSHRLIKTECELGSR